MDAKFVTDVSDHFQCVVCHNVLKDPVLIVGCGHRLCRSCFEDIRDHATRNKTQLLCPHDRSEIDADKVVEDKAAARMIMDLMVKCQHSDEGCTWSGELRQLHEHVEKQCKVTEMKNFMKKMDENFRELERKNNEINEKFIQKDNRLEELKADLEKKDVSIKTVQRMLVEKDMELALLKYEVSSMKIDFLQIKNTISTDGGNDDGPNGSKKISKDEKEEQMKKEIVQKKDQEIAHLIHQLATVKNDLSQLRNSGENKKNSENLAGQQSNSTADDNKNKENVLGKRDANGKRVQRKQIPSCSSGGNSDTPACPPNCYHCSAIQSLQKHVMNVQEYVPGVQTTFIWNLKDFAHHKKLGGDTFSPKFYSDIGGHCCELAIDWCPDEQNIGLYFSISKNGIYLNDQIFANKVTFMVEDKFGKLYQHVVTKDYLVKNPFEFLPGESKSTEGYGAVKFLKYSQFKNFVVDDILKIKVCVE